MNAPDRPPEQHGHDVTFRYGVWVAPNGSRVEVIRVGGSTPRPLGSKMAVSEKGQISGSVSGGCIEGAVFEEAQAVLRDGKPRRVAFGISDEQAWTVGLSCGGTVEVLVEKID